MQNRIKDAILDVPDFPKPGIIFKDITPVFSHSEVFKELIDHLNEGYKNRGITKIVGVESSGTVNLRVSDVEIGPVAVAGEVELDVQKYYNPKIVQLAFITGEIAEVSVETVQILIRCLPVVLPLLLKLVLL